MYRQAGNQFCEMPSNATICVADAARWLCDCLLKIGDY